METTMNSRPLCGTWFRPLGAGHSYPDKYDLLMDIATEKFSHLEIVGATIQMLLAGVNAELKNAVEQSSSRK